MANSKKSKTSTNKGKLDPKKAAKDKTDKSTEESNVPDQPLADMND